MEFRRNSFGHVPKHFVQKFARPLFCSRHWARPGRFNVNQVFNNLIKSANYLPLLQKKAPIERMLIYLIGWSKNI